MRLIRPVRRRPMRVVLVGAFALAVTSCGGASPAPAVPGAEPPAAPIEAAGGRGVGPAVFTPSPTGEPSGIDASSTGSKDPTESAAVESGATASTTPSSTTLPAATIVDDPSLDTGPSDEASDVSSDLPEQIERPSSGGATAVIPTVTGWPAFDLHLMTLLDDGSHAVSATVLQNGEIVHEVAIGVRTDAGEPVAVGDRFRIASISKVITAVTALQLVEQGAIGLDDPVGERLAARVGVSTPSAGVEQITLRMLLTHRSGIAQYENLMFRREVESCSQAAGAGLSRSLERPPATTFRYSNLNFCLAGLLIEDLTGEPYQQVVQRELLDPLGISGMRLAGTFDVTDGDVEHRSDDGRNYMEVLDGAGSWIASPTDVARLVDALDPATPGWAPLGPTMLAEMRTITVDPPVVAEPTAEGAVDGAVADAAASTTVAPPPPPTSGYGMGLMIFGPEAFGHTGTLESTSAMVVRRSDGITWAITVSGDAPGSGRRLAPIVADALRYAGR